MWDCNPDDYEVGEIVQANLIADAGEIYGDRRTYSNYTTLFVPLVILICFLAFIWIKSKKRGLIIRLRSSDIV